VSVTTTSPSLLEAALDYARRGWPVFPCSPKTKRPLLPMDKDADNKPIKGSGGVKKASTDLEQIRAWWNQWPRAMIGVAVGEADLLVVDFDPRTDIYCLQPRRSRRLPLPAVHRICRVPARRRRQ